MPPAPISEDPVPIGEEPGPFPNIDSDYRSIHVPSGNNDSAPDDPQPSPPESASTQQPGPLRCDAAAAADLTQAAAAHGPTTERAPLARALAVVPHSVRRGGPNGSFSHRSFSAANAVLAAAAKAEEESAAAGPTGRGG